MIGAQARDRIAIPLKTGLVSAVGAYLILVLAVATFFNPAYAFVSEHLGYAPSRAAGQPFGEGFAILAYAGMAWFAWHQLRKARAWKPLRAPSRPELLIFGATLIVILIVNQISDTVISALGYGDHVQAGFEGFSVTMNTPAATAFAIVLTALTGVVFAPCAEELAIRGLLFGGLASRFGILPAAMLSGVVFGALHGDPIYFTVLAIHGSIVALAYAATGNLIIPIALHASMNAITFWFAITPSLIPR